MSASLRAITLVAALAATPLAARAADPAPAAFDAQAAWTRFLADADIGTATKAYDALNAVSYDLASVDQAACTAHRDELAHAVEVVPVSLALRHAAVLCAQATKDDAALAAQNVALDALAALALAQAKGPEPALAAPIRVGTARDAQALLALAGFEASYEYYVSVRPARYMSYVKVVVDPETNQERHLAFDVVDTMNTINRKDAYSGYPMQRVQIADLLVDQEADSGLLRAVDVRAVREAATVATPHEKIAKVRDAANAGGLQSAIAWMALCVRTPAEDCTDLVDALLTGSEKRQAIPMALLAFAYANGIGVAKDEGAARTLLDAADARWKPAAASAFAASMWSVIGGGEMPPFLRERMQRSVAAGNLQALLADVDDRIERKIALDAAARARLSGGDANLRGAGYAALAQDAFAHDAAPAGVDWLRRAAEAGNDWAEAQYGWRLTFGRDVAEDEAAGEKWLRAAAQDGQPFAARMLAAQATSRGEWMPAMSWLLAPASADDVPSLLDLARLLASGRVGKDKIADGVSMLENLANAGVSDARRQLAAMALEGVAMEKSPAKAEAWLRADADRGDHESEAMLGTYYLQGLFGKVDEAEGKRLLERAIAAKEPTAFVSYAAWLYGRKTPDARKQAVDVWQRGLAVDSPLNANNFAWTLCTSPYDDVRDGKRGLDVAAQIGAQDTLSPGYLDTVAACAAATGDYAAAVKMQKRVLTLFEKMQQDATEPDNVTASLKAARERLALYEAGKPYSEPDR